MPCLEKSKGTHIFAALLQRKAIEVKPNRTTFLTALRTRMQSSGEKIASDHRFDEDLGPFASNGSSEDDAPPSTLYDPSVLALSPELRAKVAARENKNQDELSAKKSSKMPFESPVHVFSPGTKQPSMPFQVDMDGKTITAADGDDGVNNDAEADICCFGLLPRWSSFMVIYLLIVVSGLIGIGVGGHQIQISINSLEGFGSAGYLIVSGVYVLGSGAVLVGMLQFICGACGIFLCYSKWKNWPVLKWMDIMDRCLVLLLAILTLALTVFNSIALSKISQESVYDSLKWATVVQTEPMYACRTEMRLECGGFSLNECVFDNNETSTSFCPGHFCIDFCKIATDDVETQEICEPCRKGGSGVVEEFNKCKEFEKARTGEVSCEGNLNKDLRDSYRKLVIGALLGFLALLSNIVVSSFQPCCV